MGRFEIRAASSADLSPVMELARYLDTVNLPHDEDHVAELLRESEAAFAAAAVGAERPLSARFTFVCEDLDEGRIVGTSTLVGQLGTRQAPYIYLDVLDEEKYSRLLDRHFHHTALRIGFSYAGPTELAGLIVAPDRRKERLGRAISFVRFLYVAARRSAFQDELLAELLPPLAPDGTSHLWEAFGRRFTGMDYKQADLLSSRNKDFIRDLFPSGHVYCSLMSEAARDVVGAVGPATLGVAKMLRREGFRYAERVDPFDGGPHYVAKTDRVDAVRRTRCVKRVESAATNESAGVEGLLARFLPSSPYFRATRCRLAERDGTPCVDTWVSERLGLATAVEAELWFLPTERSNDTPPPGPSSTPRAFGA